MIATTICGLTTLAMFGSQGSGGAGQQSSPLMMVGWLVIMVALFYFMLIRPQQRKEKDRKRLVESIKTGDRVLFGGGLIGIVANIKDNLFVIKIADNTKIEVVRAAVTRVLTKDEDLSSDQKE